MNRSGWCLKVPVTEFNQKEHDECLYYFMNKRVCGCDCGHKGARVREGMDTGPAPETAKKTRKAKSEE